MTASIHLAFFFCILQYTPFYGTMMKWDWYLHILRYSHFTDSRNDPDRTDENFDRLWKIRDLFDVLNATFSKFYNLSENLASNEVLFPLREGWFSNSTYQRNASVSESKFSTLWLIGYMDDMKVYLGA